MSVFTRQTIDAYSPGALAAEHARAKQEYENRRANVIQRATKRQEALVAHADEIEREIAAHANLLSAIGA